LERLAIVLSTFGANSFLHAPRLAPNIITCYAFFNHESIDPRAVDGPFWSAAPCADFDVDLASSSTREKDARRKIYAW
jgi:hypothetical protein